MHRKPFFIVLLILILASSCVSRKQLPYFTGLQNDTQINNPNKDNYKVKKGDKLLIKINSYEEKINQYFNGSSMHSQYGSNVDAYSFFNSYEVNDSGVIKLPLIGTIYSEGMTIDSVQRQIQTKLDKVFKFTFAIVKISNFRITVIGEVNAPGTFTIYNDHISLPQALGLARDLTDFGDRNKVKIMRETPDGQLIKIVDLQDSETIKSDSYYLQPDDIIYVPPVKARSFKINSTAINIGLSSLTLLAFIVNVLKK